MRHILIIISFMLLTSPLYGDSHIVKNHFGWITSSGFQLKEFGDNNDHPIYNGEAENGKPNGMGIMSFPDGRKYVGQWKDGKEHGLGALSYVMGERKGEKYEGEFKDGKMWNIIKYFRRNLTKIFMIGPKIVLISDYNAFSVCSLLF